MIFQKLIQGFAGVNLAGSLLLLFSLALWLLVLRLLLLFWTSVHNVGIVLALSSLKQHLASVRLRLQLCVCLLGSRLPRTILEIGWCYLLIGVSTTPLCTTMTAFEWTRIKGEHITQMISCGQSNYRVGEWTTSEPKIGSVNWPIMTRSYWHRSIITSEIALKNDERMECEDTGKRIPHIHVTTY